MRPVFRTVSFWACIVMAWINMVLLFIAKNLHNKPLQHLALLTMAACAVGAFSHWYLDQQARKERERAQSQRRR